MWFHGSYDIAFFISFILVFCVILSSFHIYDSLVERRRIRRKKEVSTLWQGKGKRKRKKKGEGEPSVRGRKRSV